MDELKSYDDKEQQGDIGDEEARKIRFRLIGPLGKIHNIVVYIQGSTARADEFIWLAGRLIPLDNRIRWNS